MAKVGYFVNNESMDVSILKIIKISVVLMRIRKALCLSLDELSKITKIATFI